MAEEGQQQKKRKRSTNNDKKITKKPRIITKKGTNKLKCHKCNEDIVKIFESEIQQEHCKEKFDRESLFGFKCNINGCDNVCCEHCGEKCHICQYYCCDEDGNTHDLFFHYDDRSGTICGYCYIENWIAVLWDGDLGDKNPGLEHLHDVLEEEIGLGREMIKKLLKNHWMSPADKNKKKYEIIERTL